MNGNLIKLTSIKIKILDETINIIHILDLNAMDTKDIQLNENIKVDLMQSIMPQANHKDKNFDIDIDVNKPKKQAKIDDFEWA